MNDHDTGLARIDEIRSETLEDVGLPGYRACTIVTPLGDEQFVLVHEDSLGTPSPAWHPDWREVARHELTGKLQGDLAPLCGRPNTTESYTGTYTSGCRKHVSVQGDTCDKHRHLADTPPAWDWPVRPAHLSKKQARR
ncbi:hypothetical protein AWB98_18025 [Mycolicibacterium conceptionense]|uniref:Uncharacterized protein n=1 Tax=Mycolicibacterium conceptionense TaxID=451644 RepID=A0ABX3V8A4_9MYCO|nr:hypothetical protein [Mycolicibacterium conceptionense]ORV25525.1 hypothetical protein AWB98_18025 [Mycolicibacterium conceptionense]